MHGVRISSMTVLAAALAACTGSGVQTSRLQPLTAEGVSAPAAQAAMLAPPASRPAGGAPVSPLPAALPSGPIVTDARVQFAPVIGATPEALPALSLRLAARAGQRGVPLVRQDGAATHVMRGYFSAFTENRETTILYVWDVTDTAGNRLHRIQGRHKLPASAEPGWKSVTPAQMEAIADRTIDELAAWLSGRTG